MFWFMLFAQGLFLVEIHVIFYRATTCNATHDIGKDFLPVRLSDKYVKCDKKNKLVPISYTT